MTTKASNHKHWGQARNERERLIRDWGPWPGEAHRDREPKPPIDYSDLSLEDHTPDEIQRWSFGVPLSASSR